MIVDIYSKGEYPSNVLSNFYPNGFTLDGVRCRSMESFLQSLKYKNVRRQVQVCGLVGVRAKRNSQAKRWQKKQVLWWRGKRYRRNGAEYRELLKRAYGAMLNQSDEFAKALKTVQNATLIHSIGKQNERETILTEKEFCTLLTELMR